jgi:hypothetical protein
MIVHVPELLGPGQFKAVDNGAFSLQFYVVTRYKEKLPTSRIFNVYIFKDDNILEIYHLISPIFLAIVVKYFRYTA